MTHNSLNAGYFVAALVFNRLICTIKSLEATPVERSRVWINKTRGNGALSQAFSWRRYKYQKVLFNTERETKRELKAVPR